MRVVYTKEVRRVRKPEMRFFPDPEAIINLAVSLCDIFPINDLVEYGLRLHATYRLRNHRTGFGLLSKPLSRSVYTARGSGPRIRPFFDYWPPFGRHSRQSIGTLASFILLPQTRYDMYVNHGSSACSLGFTGIVGKREVYYGR